MADGALAGARSDAQWTMRTLSPGESVTCSIDSKPRWVPTGITLEEGAEYHLTASGTWVDWLPKYTCGPAGYASDTWILRHSERFRSARGDRWFALIGGVDADTQTQFLIGEGVSYRPTVSGELTCFANDVRLMRWNNKGSVSLTVERLG